MKKVTKCLQSIPIRVFGIWILSCLLCTRLIMVTFYNAINSSWGKDDPEGEDDSNKSHLRFGLSLQMLTIRYDCVVICYAIKRE